MQTCRVYIVEDEGILAMNLEASIQRLGHEVLGIFYSGEKALAAVAKNRPDIVLMDISLKGKMSGIEAARKLQEMGIRIIFITGNTDPRTLKKAMNINPDGFLQKPVQADDIREAIQKVTC